MRKNQQRTKRLADGQTRHQARSGLDMKRTGHATPTAHAGPSSSTRPWPSTVPANWTRRRTSIVCAWPTSRARSRRGPTSGRCCAPRRSWARRSRRTARRWRWIRKRSTPAPTWPTPWPITDCQRKRWRSARDWSKEYPDEWGRIRDLAIAYRGCWRNQEAVDLINGARGAAGPRRAGGPAAFAGQSDAGQLETGVRRFRGALFRRRGLAARERALAAMDR